MLYELTRYNRSLGTPDNRLDFCICQKERALTWLVEAYRQGGKMAQAQTLLAEALAEDPTNGNLLCHLMQTLHEDGMTHQALRAYETFVKALKKAGLEPAEATTDLYERLKRAPRVLDLSALPMSTSLSLPSSSLAEQHQEHASQARETTEPLLISAGVQDAQTTLLPLFTEAVKQGILQAAGELGNGRRSEAPATQQTGSRQSLESDLPADRREATKQIGSLLTLFATPDVLSPLQPLLQLADTPKGPGIDEETLDHFTKLNEICRQLSEENDLQTAERLLWSYLPKAVEFAQISSEHQRTAANIATQGYLLAASLAGHRNDLKARQHLSEQALLYAGLAHDPTLHVAALRQLALTFDYLERPEKVLQTYERTVPLLNDVSPLLRACVYAGMSGAYAQQHRRQEADRFLGLAYEHFPQKLEDEPGYLHTIGRYATLVICEGLTLLDFEQPRGAKEVFDRIDGLHPKIALPEKARIEVLNYQAEMFTALQDMEPACVYLEAAMKGAVTIGSKIRFQDSLAVFQQMWQLWRHESQVQSLVDLIVQASHDLSLR